MKIYKIYFSQKNANMKQSVQSARYGVPVSMRTPYHGGSIRGEEIDEWLRLHPYVKKYAIVDDDSDMLPHQPLFKTTWEEGLTEEVARRIEMHLRD